ncbi:MAG: HEPN domain-containing protein [Victivallales bacterium]
MKKHYRGVEITALWAEKAENDLLNAEHTLKMESNCPFDTICFHSQQCAEKYIKALLIFHSIDFPKTHDLAELVELFPENLEIGVDVDDLSILNSYSVSVRYPGFEEPLTRRDATKALSIAKKIRNAIKGLLK